MECCTEKATEVKERKRNIENRYGQLRCLAVGTTYGAPHTWSVVCCDCVLVRFSLPWFCPVHLFFYQLHNVRPCSSRAYRMTALRGIPEIPTTVQIRVTKELQGEATAWKNENVSFKHCDHTTQDCACSIDATCTLQTGGSTVSLTGVQVCEECARKCNALATGGCATPCVCLLDGRWPCVRDRCSGAGVTRRRRC